MTHTIAENCHGNLFDARLMLSPQTVGKNHENISNVPCPDGKKDGVLSCGRRRRNEYWCINSAVISATTKLMFSNGRIDASDVSCTVRCQMFHF